MKRESKRENNFFDSTKRRNWLGEFRWNRETEGKGTLFFKRGKDRFSPGRDYFFVVRVGFFYVIFALRAYVMRLMFL